MRLSAFPLTTLKDNPADAEIISHQLMLRSGFIRKLASGMYSWMPLGMRVLAKIERIVREEMTRAGAFEVLMPSVQPAELWQESGRWDQYGPELLRFHDRHGREFCFGPTHEEVITDIARRDLQSYRQLPVNYFQIQTKFRDEIRPRFGVMRAREFIMKDAYSFHIDQESLNEGYQAMYDAYTRIFERMHLKFRVVQADPGAIGGNLSQEFHVIADSGEDAIAYSDSGSYAANVELAIAARSDMPRPEPAETTQTVDTPGVRSIKDLTAFMKVGAQKCVKTLLVDGDDDQTVALVLRGDHEFNALKAERLDGVAKPLRMANTETIKAATGCTAGFCGPVDLGLKIYADHDALAIADFVCGANQENMHLRGVNWGRDLVEPEAADLRNVVSGDPSPDGNGTLSIARGIEVGHIFQLGDKYSEAMKATVLDEHGKNRVILMGCYGIGITRIAAAAIEQNHDENGIIWPMPIAPFQAMLIPLNINKSARVRDAAEALYQELLDQGVEILYDDRDLRPGVKFADADLLGIPLRIVMGEKGLDAGTLEIKRRSDKDVEYIEQADILSYIRDSIDQATN